MRYIAFISACLCLFPVSLAAESLGAARTIRSQAIITQADLTLLNLSIAGGFVDPNILIGQEARRVIYAGQPIRQTDVGPAAIIERNQIVPIVFQQGALVISAEGRALGRGGVGDRLRVMNSHSKSVVSGIVTKSGAIRVGF